MYQPYHTDTAFPLLLLIPDSILAVNDTIDFTHFVDTHDMKLTKRFIVFILKQICIGIEVINCHILEAGDINQLCLDGLLTNAHRLHKG